MGVSYMFTSGKGGTGKSTTVAALASCLAVLGKRVLCVDMDLRLPNLDLILGMSDLTTLDISDVAKKRYTLDEAVVEHPDVPGLFLLAGPALYDNTLDAAMLSHIVALAKERYDYCFIDGPAGLDENFYATARGVEAVIVVTTTDATSQRDAQRVVMELDALGVQDMRMIINRIRVKMLLALPFNADDIIDFVGVPLLGIVPEDPDVIAAAGRLRPLVLYSRRFAACAFLRIAKRLMGQDVPLGHK